MFIIRAERHSKPVDHGYQSALSNQGVAVNSCPNVPQYEVYKADTYDVQSILNVRNVSLCGGRYPGVPMDIGEQGMKTLSVGPHADYSIVYVMNDRGRTFDTIT